MLWVLEQPTKKPELTRKTVDRARKVRNNEYTGHILTRAKTANVVKHIARKPDLSPQTICEALHRRRLDADHVAVWVELLRRNDAQFALQSLGLLFSEPVEHSVPCPDWFYLEIPLMLREQADAPYVASMLGSWRFAQLSYQDQGILVARTIQAFISANHLVAAREAVDWLADQSSPEIRGPHTWACCLRALATTRARGSTSLLAAPDSFLRMALAKLDRAMHGTAKTRQVYYAMLHKVFLGLYPDSGVRLVQEMLEHGFDVYDDVLDLVLANATAEEAAQVREDFASMRSNEPPSSAEPIDDIDVSLGRGAKVFEQGETAMRNVAELSSAIRELALASDDRLLSAAEQVDASSFTMILDSLCARGEADKALCLFQSYARTTDNSTVHAFVDIADANLLMSHLNRSMRFDVVFEMFDSLVSHYRLHPDHATLSIVLDTARYASAAAGKGFTPGQDPVSLHGDHLVNDSWHGQSAWRTAQVLAFDVLEQNFTKLAPSISGPLDRRNLLYDWWTGRSSSRELVEYTPSFVSTFLPDPPAFPSIHPTERTFRSLIQLIGHHAAPANAVHLISRTLGWMRALECPPTKSTLALAQMYMGEAALKPDELERIDVWLGQWLSPASIPTEMDIARLRRGSR